MLLQLLPELQEKISSFLFISDLHNLACCNSQTNETFKEYIWRVVKITYKQLLNEQQLEKNSRMKNLEHTKTLHLHGNDYLHDEEQKTKSVMVLKSVFSYCDPKVLYLYTATVTNDLFSVIGALKNLKELFMCSGHTSDEDVQILCQNAIRLEKLTVAGTTEVTDEALDYINQLTLLSHVNFSGCFITDVGLTKIASLNNLKELKLDFCTSINGKSFKDFSSLSLKCLTVSNCNFNDDVILCISKIPTLQHLELGSNHITDNGIKYLICLQELKSLELELCQVSNVALTYIALLNNLEKLLLSSQEITDEGLTYLSNLKRLRELRIRGCNKVNGSGLVHLVDCARLQVLDASSCGIINSNMCSVFNTLTRLTHLNIGRNSSLTDLGLKDIGQLKELRELDVSHTKISRERGLEYIKSLPCLKSLIITYRHEGVQDLKAYSSERGVIVFNQR